MVRRLAFLVAAAAALTLLFVGGRPAPAQGASYVTVFAVGDLAAGDFRPQGTGDEAVADLIARHAPAAVIGLGDLNQGTGCLEYYRAAGGFEGSYGRLKHLFVPAPGNHDWAKAAPGSQWDTPPDSDGLRCSQRRYGQGYFDYFGSAAGPRGNQGFYSRMIGGWEIITLNSNCNVTKPGATRIGDSPPCGRSDPQVNFLRQRLAHPVTTCQAVAFHHPRFATAAPYPSDRVYLEWIAKVAATYKADLLLSGHNHAYERLAPVNPYTEKVDYDRGIRQYVVGTGGFSHIGFRGGVHTASRARVAGLFGALRLKLTPTAWSSSFMGIDGSVRDTVAARCR